MSRDLGSPKRGKIDDIFKGTSKLEKYVSCQKSKMPFSGTKCSFCAKRRTGDENALFFLELKTRKENTF